MLKRSRLIVQGGCQLIGLQIDSKLIDIGLYLFILMTDQLYNFIFLLILNKMKHLLLPPLNLYKIILHLLYLQFQISQFLQFIPILFPNNLLLLFNHSNQSNFLVTLLLNTIRNPPNFLYMRL